MNRTDQASDPSMEEILASIRHIISDDGRSEPNKDFGLTARTADSKKGQTASLDTLPEEDVLDLTEELVFSVDEEAPAPKLDETSTVQSAPASEEVQTIGTPQTQGDTAASQPPPTATSPAPSDFQRPDRSRLQRQEALQRPAPTGSRPVWSRRELPNSPGNAPPIAKGRQDIPPPKPPQKNWTEDIQMPIPGQGPVSLIAPGDKDVGVQVSSNPAEGNKEPAARQDGGARPGLAAPQEAAVAVLAEQIARSAAGAMESGELKSARQIDFEALDRERKAEVSEKFANAIQGQEGADEHGPLPTLLDEVLRQDFIRESAPEPSADRTEPKDAQPNSKTSARQEVPPSQPKSGSPREPRPESRLSRPPETRTEATERQQPMETAMPDQALVQAQFVGAGQSQLASQGGRALEDAVREMLRPLLVQWLNENMPRILENAIRDEIATRGLLPK